VTIDQAIGSRAATASATITRAKITKKRVKRENKKNYNGVMTRMR